MAVAQLTEASSYSGTTCKFSFPTRLPSGNHWSACCWAYLTGNAATYYDLIATSDDNNVIGIGVILSAGKYFLNVGDLNSDQTSSRQLPRLEWHHFAIIVEPNGANTQVFAYLDGIKQIGPVALVAPSPPTSFRLWNSRASTTDSASQWVGHACGFKAWDCAISEAEMRGEISYLRAQRREGLFCEVPCFDTDLRTIMTGGRALDSMTVTGTFTSNALSLPGVTWDRPPPWRRLTPLAAFNPPPPFLISQAVKNAAWY